MLETATVRSMAAHTWEPSTEETQAGRIMLPTTDMGLPCNWGLNPRERHLWKWIWGDLALMYFYVASRLSSVPRSDQSKGWWKQELSFRQLPADRVLVQLVSSLSVPQGCSHLYITYMDLIVKCATHKQWNKYRRKHATMCILAFMFLSNTDYWDWIRWIFGNKKIINYESSKCTLKKKKPDQHSLCCIVWATQARVTSNFLVSKK